tara:strand:+ start:89 stop:436 length:348 start_codon:yes stop_codon:yes gene_type:complete
MEIKIEDYLDKEEIKNVVKQAVKEHVIELLGDSKGLFMSVLVADIRNKEIQAIIPDFKEQINIKVRQKIEEMTAESIFMSNIGWRSDGNKIFNEILSNNKPLLDAKFKEIFKKVN